MDGGDALGEEEVLGAEDRLLDLFLGRERDRAIDPLLRSIDENPCGLALRVFQGLAAGRVRVSREILACRRASEFAQAAWPSTRRR